MESKYKLLLSNTAIFAIGNLLVKIISFFLIPLYTSVLTTEQYGVAELLNNTIEMVLPIATLSIVEALYRFSIDRDTNKKSLFTNSIFMILLGDVVVALVAMVLFHLLDYKYAYHFFLLYVTTSFYKLTTQFSRGLGHVKRYAFYGVLNSLLLVTSNLVLLVKFNTGITGYLLSFSIAYGLTAIVALLVSNQYSYVSLKSFDVNLLKNMLRYSLPSIPNMISWWINSLSDRYIVLLYWGASSAGLYTAASKLPALINMITAIFQQAWQYSTATEIHKKDSKPFFSIVFRVYMYLCIIASSTVMVFNKSISRILFQEEFYRAWEFVPLLVLAATFGCIATYFGTFYNALKNNYMLMISTMIGAVINVSLNFILIPIYEGLGAAIATAISYFIVMIIRMIDIKKHIDIELNIYRFMNQIVVLSITALVVSFESSYTTVITILLFLFSLFSDYKVLKRTVFVLINKVFFKT